TYPATSSTCCSPLLSSLQAAIASANERRLLPDNYLDVTEGIFAKFKRWIKRKLLGNFKHAYVDVLSRQQSEFNRSIIQALHELAECCALLDQTSYSQLGVDLASVIQRTVDSGKGNELAGLIQHLMEQIVRSEQTQRELEERLVTLERAVRAQKHQA